MEKLNYRFVALLVCSYIGLMSNVRTCTGAKQDKNNDSILFSGCALVHSSEYICADYRIEVETKQSFYSNMYAVMLVYREL